MSEGERRRCGQRPSEAPLGGCGRSGGRVAVERERVVAHLDQAGDVRGADLLLELALVEVGGGDDRALVS